MWEGDHGPLERSQREVISELLWKGLHLGHSLLFGFFPFTRLCSGLHPQTSRGRRVPGRTACPCRSYGETQAPAWQPGFRSLDLPLPHFPDVVSVMIK